MTLRLSVLDQSPVGADHTPADALLASVDLAREAERLGYCRYWVAEHHHSPAFAGSAPEILVAALLGRTTRLRVGSGGVLLPRYHPLKVAEVFRVLSALHPGRVNLGIGRAGGPAGDFPQRLDELRRCLELSGDSGLPSAHVMPAGTERPSLWLLGGGTGSAQLAAERGTAFAFAHFLSPGLGVDALESYRRAFVPGSEGVGPQGALAVRVIVADSAARAESLAQSLLLWRSRKDLGDDSPVPSPATAHRHRWSEAELSRAASNRRPLVVGTPEQVHGRLTDLASEHGVDELIVNTITHDPADRLRSYRLLAEVFGLESAPVPVVRQWAGRA